MAGEAILVKLPMYGRFLFLPCGQSEKLMTS